MIAISIDKVEEVLEFYKDEIETIIEKKNQAVVALQKKGITTKTHNPEQTKYLEKLIKNFRKIILATPSEISKMCKENTFEPTKENWSTFKEELIKTLGYKDLRSSFYPKYFQKLGIKACVYCNSTLTVCTEKEEKIVAKFQVDHYLDKASYPCFSISFFNLYPTCASCNNIKGSKKVDFILYSDDLAATTKSKFNFSFKAGSVAKYLVNPKIEEIALDFKEPNDDFQKTFDIEGIYNTQKDIAEELIIKAQIYSKSYQNSLTNDFPEVFTTASLNNRIFIGNYCAEDEIHKRPMSKFMQDLAKDLGLL